MWDLPGPGIEPVSPALAGRFLTTVPPGKPKSPPLNLLLCDSAPLADTLPVPSCSGRVGGTSAAAPVTWVVGCAEQHPDSTPVARPTRSRLLWDFFLTLIFLAHPSLISRSSFAYIQPVTPSVTEAAMLLSGWVTWAAVERWSWRAVCFSQNLAEGPHTPPLHAPSLSPTQIPSLTFLPPCKHFAPSLLGSRSLLLTHFSFPPMPPRLFPSAIYRHMVQSGHPKYVRGLDFLWF